MELLRCTQADDLRRLALPFLIADEAAHGLLIGLILGTETLPAGSLAALVIDGDAVVGAALRLDNRMIVSRVDDTEALSLLASTVAEDSRTTMVAGAARTVDAVRERSRRIITFTMEQTIYATDAMNAGARVANGRRRPADDRDRDLLIDAHLELNASLGTPESRATATTAAARLVASGNLSVWESGDGRVVSCAGTSGPTVHGIRLNYVYTPPEHRGAGFASALVRDLTRSLLEGGRSFVFLHADRANATATALYERLGFANVADFAMIRFSDAEAPNV